MYIRPRSEVSLDAMTELYSSMLPVPRIVKVLYVMGMSLKHGRRRIPHRSVAPLIPSSKLAAEVTMQSQHIPRPLRDCNLLPKWRPYVRW